MNESIKVPLNLFIVWHPQFKEGINFANALYTNYTRNVCEPLSRGIGIPVYFRSNYVELNCDNCIKYTGAQRTAIVLLIDTNMLLSKEWHRYIDNIVDQSNLHTNVNIYPVALTGSAFKMSEKINKINFIRLYEQEDDTNKISDLIYKLTHELCRLLYGMKRISEISREEYSPSPIKLFISHAKEDGKYLAKSIHDYVKSKTPLDTFFDAYDISFGYDFPKEIEAHIENSVLLIIHSDKYSSREWCRREVILAKKYSRPIIVINTLNVGEDRSFPYMSNVKCIRLISIENEYIYTKLLTSILLETLRFKYQELFIQFVIKKFNITSNINSILSYPPELISLLYLQEKNNGFIVYPDPPLSDEETEILKMYNNKLQIITPLLLPSISKKAISMNSEFKILDKFKVGISISENPDIESCGFENVHLQDISIEIARYLLVSGALLVYGGDINYDKRYNFINILVELVNNHNKDYKDIKSIIHNYVPYPLYNSIDKEMETCLLDVCNFIKIPKLEIECNNILSLPYKEKYILAKNLTNMRNLINNDVDARIVIGGKTKNYMGIYPGLIEEVYIALKTKKPVFLIGAFGGAARTIIKCIEGTIPNELTESYQLSDLDYREFYQYYNSIAKVQGFDPIDYAYIVHFFKTLNIKSLNNGLTNKENESLFTSNNITEIIILVLKGLINIKHKEDSL